MKPRGWELYLKCLTLLYDLLSFPEFIVILAQRKIRSVEILVSWIEEAKGIANNFQ